MQHLTSTVLREKCTKVICESKVVDASLFLSISKKYSVISGAIASNDFGSPKSFNISSRFFCALIGCAEEGGTMYLCKADVCCCEVAAAVKLVWAEELDDAKVLVDWLNMAAVLDPSVFCFFFGGSAEAGNGLWDGLNDDGCIKYSLCKL